MKPTTMFLAIGMVASTQAMAWGDFLGNVIQGAAQQAVTGTVQQAVTPQQPAYGARVPAATPYGYGGCVQNVPAGPPGVFADVDRNGCVDQAEYANYTNYLAKNAPQYLNGMHAPAAAPAAALVGQPAPVMTEDAAKAQAVGTAVQGLMGLFGR